MNAAASIVAAFRAVRSQEAQADAVAAAELSDQMSELAASPAFRRLLDEVAPAHDAIYDRWLSGQSVAPDQMAFARLVRLLRERPGKLVEMARQILDDTRRI